MSKKFEQEKKDLQQEADEIKLQLKLGKAEAVSYLENKKSEFSDFVDDVKDKLAGPDSPLGGAASGLQEKMDELKVQLALGRMETHDAYCSQRERIEEAIDGIQAQLKKLEERGKDEIGDLIESFESRSKTFKMKLESAAINLGAGAMLATHEVESAVQSLDKKLHRLAEMTGEEISEARKYVRSRIEAHSSNSKT